MIAKVLFLSLAAVHTSAMHVIQHLDSIQIPKGRYIKLSNKNDVGMLSSDQSVLN
jgi:hypothetical protein